MSHRPHRLAFLGLILFASGSPAVAQFDEEADLIHGLVARYESDKRTIERIDGDLSHDWSAAAPDPRLPVGPFKGTWSTGLLLREEGTYTFHAYLHGAVTVEVDGLEVLKARRNESGWISGEPVELDFGLLELNVTFHKTAEAARIQLFWSSDRFPLEPIPPHQLFREEGRPDLALIEEGRQLFTAHRCNRCHVRDNDPPAPPAPGLHHVTSGLNRDWLIAKLLDKNAEAAHAKMPSFGFSEGEADAVAAWIEYVAQPAELMSTPAPKRAKGDDPPPVEQAASVLVHSIGCLACHAVGDLGHSGPLGGGDLSHIGAKRSADWINTWLARPERLNVQHRMPVFKLTANERALLVTALTKLGRGDNFNEIEPSGKRETDLVKRGRELATAARCAACHQIPAMEAELTGLPTLAKPVTSWEDSCLGESANRTTGRPVYPRINSDAVISYLNSRIGELSPHGPLARGRHILEQRNCLGCHERDLTKGVVPTAGAVAAQVDGLRGQSQSLIPPALTAVGDKLYKEPLTLAVSGEQKQLRLPWLAVRMPRFAHDADEKRDLVAYLIGHDRIPDGAPANGADLASGGRQPSDAADVSATADGEADATSDSAHRGTDVPRSPGDIARSPGDAQTLVVGRTLAGSGGFNCVACHAFGDYEPRNVALGTKGSDLKQIDKTMRAEFFHRWTRDPLRVVPGMEMPSIKRPVEGVLGGDLDAQLAAVWAAINDPDFTAPPNPAQVEQHIVLQPGDPPRIIRDVFTVSDANGGGYVARGLAMGFDNGHSLLFDIDNFCIRGWTFGDFAQQRTEGKSWYWDLAGVDVATGFDNDPEVSLFDATLYVDVPKPWTDDAPTHRLVSYDVEGGVVTIKTELVQPARDGEVVVGVTQTFRPWAPEDVGESTPGIVRTITTHDRREVLDDLQRVTFRIKQKLDPPAAMAMGTDWPVPGIRGQHPDKGRNHFAVIYRSTLDRPIVDEKPRPELPLNDASVMTLPGFTGQRLQFPSSIMPTAMAFLASGGRHSPDTSDASATADREAVATSDSNDRGTTVPRSPVLVFTSLKGHVYLANDTDEDEIEDSLTVFEEGLAAPFGILADGDSLLVAHKPELLRLEDTDGDGKADKRTIVADGWGYTDNYHDWTTGPVRDRAGNLYLALGSDYQQPDRPSERSLWRGKVLIKPRNDRVRPYAHELRFPQGIAIDGQGRLFVTDQQGVANTFNEINHILPGRHYGVEAMHEEHRNVPETRAAVQLPHPWTRSVNGLMFLPDDLDGPLAPFAGHGIGAEYNSKFLIRISLQEVRGELQGATYYFSRPTWKDEANTFQGPMCVALAPTGDLYVGSIHDSGWLGGQNTGEIVRLSPNGAPLPNGIRELRATAGGFEIEFLRPVDAARANDADSYSLSGYTRVWEGSYATGDSGRYSPQIESVTLSGDGRTVTLTVDELRQTYVYEVNCAKLDDELFPATGHYTMNRIPRE